MSVFQPVDVRAPNARRKQLVSKLMAQQSAQAPARSALVGVSNHLGREVGGRAITMGHNNVLASVLSKLGVQGPNEVSPGQSNIVGSSDPYSSGHYVSPHEVDPNGGGASPIQPGGGLGALAPFAGGGTPYNQPPPVGTQLTTPQGDNYVADDMSGSNFPQFVNLGNGMYYDPITDAVHGGGPNGGR